MYRTHRTLELMAEALKIKLTIADRLYPLTIQADQEEGLRKAAKRIEEMIKRFEQSYAVRDKQDVLAMSALQFAAQVEQKELDSEALSDSTERSGRDSKKEAKQ